MVAFVLTVLSSACQGQTEENRGNAAYLLPLCKTWLDVAEKKGETVPNMGRMEPVRLTGVGVCVGFVVGVFETLRSIKLFCPPRDITNPQIVQTLANEIEKHPNWMQEDFGVPVRAVDEIVALSQEESSSSNYSAPRSHPLMRQGKSK